MDPASLGDYPALAAVVDSRRFLTRYDATLHPVDIAEDIRFTRAAADGAYRAVVVEKRYVSGVSSGVVVAWIMVGVAALAAVVSGGLTWYRKRRRPAVGGG